MRKSLISSLILYAAAGLLPAQDDTRAVETSLATPAAGLPAVPATGNPDAPPPASASTTTRLRPLTPPAKLQGIQVRPYADRLRLILKFDRTIPYTIKPELIHNKITLQLFNVELGYLPPELNRIGDERLRAIWLKRRDPELTILELRVGTPGLRIEHFMLDRPMALVIDIFQTDELSRVTAPGATAMAMDFGDPQQFERSVALELSPVVPEDWFEPDNALSTSRTLTAHDDTTSPTTELDQAAGGEGTMDGMVVVADEELDIRPRKWDYEFFPVELLEMSTPLGEEIKELFLRRRWSSVLQKGVKEHLEVRDLTSESYMVLYMVAEARWQMGLRFNPPPYAEMRNFYEQARRAMPGGEFGAFASWRLAQDAWYNGNHEIAAARADLALVTGDPQLREMAEMMKLEALTRTQRNAEAILLARELTLKETSDHRKALIARLEGVAYQQAGYPQAAWEAFDRASELDSGWVHMDFHAAEVMARTALDVEQYERARGILTFIHENAPYRNDEMKIKIALLYAEALMHLGEEQVAIDTYATLLSDLDKTAKGEEVLKAALRQFPEQMAASEKLYSELLWRRGKIREAMTEFNRAYNQNLKAGINNAPMRPVIEKILPSFMEYANRHGMPFDSVQAWQYYNFAIEDESIRARCLPSLVDSLEMIGMVTEAEKLLNDLKAAGHPRYNNPGPRETLQTGRMAFDLNRIPEAIAHFEKLTDPDISDSYREDALHYLARSYQLLGRSVEAAQAWQLLAEVPSLEGPKRGEAILNGAKLFLDVGMHEQAVELGIQSLYIEQQFLKDANEAGWSQETANGLRLILAQGYQERRDYTRASIILDSVLLETSLTPEQRAEGQLMLADRLAALGNPQSARELLRKTAADTATPALFREVAGTALGALDWDASNPAWSVDWEFRPKSQRD